MKQFLTGSSSGDSYIDDFMVYKIGKHPLFQDLPGFDRQMLYRIEARVKHYRAGEVIFSQGERVDAIGVVLSGEVEGGFKGQKYYQMIDRFHEGDIFAEAIAINFGASPVEVVANQESEVLFIGVDRLLNSPDDPDVCRLLSRITVEMTGKIMVLSSRLRTLRNPAVISRVASYLLEEAQANQHAQGKAAEHPDEVYTNFTQAELGDYLGASRSRVSSALALLTKHGLIEPLEDEKSAYRLLQRDELAWIAEHGQMRPAQEKEEHAMEKTIAEQANVDATETMRVIVTKEPLFEKFLQYKGFPFSRENPITEIVTFNDVVEMMHLNKDEFLQEYVDWRASESSY